MRTRRSVTRLAGQGDYYHDLPEINIQGDAPEVNYWPWILAGAAVLGVAWAMKGKRHAR